MIIQNTAGELEAEKRPRTFNALEAFGVYTFILLVLWPFCYYFGVMPGNTTIENVAVWPLIAGGIYLLFITPWIHGDSAASWGLGSPRALWRMMTTGPEKQQWTLRIVVPLLFLALNAVVYARWPDVVRLFGLHKLTLGATPVNELHHSFPGVLVVFFFGALLAGAYVTCALRYDNFIPSFIMAMKISIPLAVMTFVGAAVSGWTQGTNPFEGLEPSQYALDALGYMFWGFLQQLLFTAYLGNRFRKAFPPSQSLTNRLAPGRRLPFAVGFGAAFGAALALLGFIGMRYGYPDQVIPWTMPVWLFVFMFPLCAAYGYVLALDRKRLLVATLAASCFAFIHINSYGLVAVTYLLGTILIYVSMEDQYRNLVALGMIHGILGSTFGQLFDNKNAGVVHVDYSVGPWNIDEPVLGILYFPMLCIAAYAAFMAWSYFHLRGVPNVIRSQA
ncbi:MAG: hypothetical protein GC168_13710 [Candidatus Hydrogenedens sp.]|nr:hypothetical protein [Candidatus Hydrogenedens sp.]